MSAVKSFSRFVLPAFLFPMGGANAQSLQIDWGTSAIAQKLITSDGLAITAGEFAIELGAFTPGFVPTPANYGQWIDNWQVFDAVTEPDSDTNGPGGTSADRFIAGSGTSSRFVGTSHLLSDQTSASEDANGVDTFVAGQQAYVFIRNSDTPDEFAEWALYTSTSGNIWQFNTVSGGQPELPRAWFVSEADTAVWGGVNGIQGAGEFTDGSSDFIIRTHTFVPEPGTGLFALACAGLLFLRQRA